MQIASSLKLVEAQLVAALRAQGSSRIHAALVREASELNDQLERYVPESLSELHDIVAFFVKRSTRSANRAAGQRDLDRALDLANRMGHLAAAPPPAQRRDYACSVALLQGGVADPAELSHWIETSPDRLVAISITDRYLAVSPANADFNHSTSARMLDMHIEQVIGKRRYVDRAAPALENSLRNGADNYIYALKLETIGQRFIRCDYQPIRDRADRVYCTTMQLTDVTATMASDHSELARAATGQPGDQRLPGTT